MRARKALFFCVELLTRDNQQLHRHDCFSFKPENSTGHTTTIIFFLLSGMPVADHLKR